MALGRISGQLLKDNLIRKGIDIAFETNLLYFNVNTNAADVQFNPDDPSAWTGKIGIKTVTPAYDLDVNGTTRSTNIISTKVDIGDLEITNNTISTLVNNITLQASPTGKILINSLTEIDNDLQVNGNTLLGDTLADDTVELKSKFISDLIPKDTNTYALGSAESRWNNLFSDKINVNGIVNTGDRIGTAPTVKNTLYVTTDGSDTNDGSAQDSTRACRTIGGALKSPLYGPGTSIKVAPGRYLENNPLLMKPYTSIIGSDLRTTSVESINKTQDLFHVNSSCYIAQMQFYNGRSGIIDPNIDRGAYAISFPRNDVIYASSVAVTINDSATIQIYANTIPEPQTGWSITIYEVNNIIMTTQTIVSQAVKVDNYWELTLDGPVSVVADLHITLTPNKLDVYKSPYIQNCTNQSGPWLYDGTMFVPNQTVQVPVAVGRTTFDDSQSTITVTFSENGNLVVPGMAINTAPQSQGFFNARTLMLVNKTFLQEQVILFINDKITNAVETTAADELIVGELYKITNIGNFTNWNYIAGTVGVDYQVGMVITVAVVGTGDGLAQSIWYNFTYAQEYCRRDTGIIIENVLYDAVFGGNSKSIEAGLAYFNGNVSIISGEVLQTVVALEHLKALSIDIIQNIDVSTTGLYTNGGTLNQITNLVLVDGSDASNAISNNINIITTILLGTETTAPGKESAPTIYYTTGPEFSKVSAEILIQNNRTFIQKEIIAWISDQVALAISGPWYNFYDYFDQSKSTKCYRDVGLIVDAISQDVLLGGNSKSIEAADSYYQANSLVIAFEKEQTKLALARARDVIIDIVQNNIVTKSTYNTETQFTDTTYYTGGYVTVPGITRNFQTMFDIIDNGVTTNVIRYTGTGLYAATGVSADDIKQATKVVSITNISGNDYLIELDKPTVGIGIDSTLYFGYTSVYPYIDSSFENGWPERWNERKVDPWGSMGGMLVDGAVVSAISPINSMVMDAYTQITQGGRGIRITNNGYAQLVSVFTIFTSIAVQADNGGICSITNSNSNFGDYCLVSKGYGKKEFTGTIYNPPVGFYTNGYYPKNGTIEVFIPDINNRPHISLVMEVEPPASYINSQGKPGFLSSIINLSAIKKDSLTITNADVTNIAVGQTIYLRDQYGNYSDPITGLSYLPANTVVTDVGYQTIYLSQPIQVTYDAGTNSTYFTLFTAGNAYYSVLSSVISDNINTVILTPINYIGNGTTTVTATVASTVGVAAGDTLVIADAGAGDPNSELTKINGTWTILNVIDKTTLTFVVDNSVSFNSGEPYVTRLGTIKKTTEGTSVIPLEQKDLELSSITEIGNLINSVITNSQIDVQTLWQTKAGVVNVVSQVLKPTLDGSGAVNKILDPTTGFIKIIQDIIYNNGSPTLSASTKNTILATIVKTGPTTQSESDARTIILANIDFIVAEVSAYLSINVTFTYNKSKCTRDVALICRCICDDLLAGGNYNTVYAGISYWSRAGTRHIVTLEENLTDNSLVPDGAFINFYQRSYMSASGYLFEYVGSGSNYGALPQVGRVDPIQSREVVQLDNGKVFFTSTDQNGDFRIGEGLVISQATGTLAGRTFQKSLFAEMTPFILALE